MAILRLVLLGAFTALAGFFIGIQVGETEPGTDDAEPGPAIPADEDPRVIALSRDLTVAQIEIDQLRDALKQAKSKKSGESGGEKTESSTPIPTGALELTSGAGRVIQSVGQAEAVFERAIAARDLETLWSLGADLLAMGPGAYPLFEELFTRLFAEINEDPAFQFAFRDEELWVGRFFRTLAEEHESFLAYGLDLARRDPETLTEPLQMIRGEVFDDDLLPVLLAFHGGDNPALTAGWLEQIERMMNGPERESIDQDTLLGSLAQIPDDRAVALILTWLESESEQDEVIRALLAHGSPAAIAALQQLLPSIPDEDLRAAIEEMLNP